MGYYIVPNSHQRGIVLCRERIKDKRIRISTSMNGEPEISYLLRCFCMSG